jgi:hypothetical protein
MDAQIWLTGVSATPFASLKGAMFVEIENGEIK